MKTCFFFDPPYTAGNKRAGMRLYNHSELDHAALFSLGNYIEYFIMTYAVSEEIERLAQKSHFKIKKIPMKNTRNQEMKEYLISNDLRWL
jgi:DNA adenine methylase